MEVQVDMLRDFRLYLDDILESIHQIRTYMADLDEEAFTEDRKTQDAVIRNLEIIGEAVGNLPEKIQKIAPEIDWRKIKGLRNILKTSVAWASSLRRIAASQNSQHC